MTPQLDATGVAKSYGRVVALRNASLTVRPGEVHALLGANGAGKSTLVKILTGAVRQDRGRILVRGTEMNIRSPAGAIRAGMVPVYQEPSMIPDLSVADTLRLTRTPLEPFAALVRELGINDLDLRTAGRDLPLATLRVLDLARALAREPDVLILDEMTAALPANLTERVLQVVGSQAAAGRSVIFISHRFPEIQAICHRATVLRDGETVGVLDIVPGVEERIVELMLGGKVERAAVVATSAAGHAGEVPRLRLRDLDVPAKLHRVSFDLYPGEVVGMVALEGQGQDELFDVLAGETRITAGSMEVNGAPVAFRHPSDAIAAGLAYVPGDRSEALLMQRSVRENVALPLSAPDPSLGPAVDFARTRPHRRGHRAAADRYPRAGRGSKTFGRQPAEGDHRPLDCGRGADAPVLRSDPRHRRAHKGGNLPADARSRRTREVDPLLHLGTRRGAARLRPGARYLRRQVGWRVSSFRHRGRTHPRRVRPAARGGAMSVLRRNGWVTSLAVFFLMLALATKAIQPDYHADDFGSLVRAALPYAFAVAAQAVVVIGGGIDLSVAAMMALTSVTAARLMDGAGEAAALWVVPLVLLFGVALGALNGLLIVLTRVPDIVVTLATLFVFQGAALLVLPTPGGGAAEWLKALIVGTVPLPLPEVITEWVPKALVLVIIALGVVWIPLRRSRLGLSIYAVGSSELAAFRSGVAVARTKIAAYALGGLFAAMGGLSLTMATGIGAPIPGPYLLASVAAVVLGGVTLGGGRGGLLGPIIAVFILRLVRTDLTLLAVDPNVTTIIEGIIMVVVVMLGAWMAMRTR